MDEDPTPPFEGADAFGNPGLPRYSAPPEETEPPSHPEVPGPLGVWRTIGTAVSLWWRDLVPISVGVLLVMVPIAIISYILQHASVPAGATIINGRLIRVSGTSDGSFLGLSLLAGLLQIVGTLAITGVIYRILLGRYLHHPATLGVSFAFARRRMGKLFAVVVLTVLVVLVGFILIIVPGIYLYVALSVAVPVAMAENLGISATLGRSRELVRDLWWHCLGVILAEGVVGGVLYYVVGGALTRAINHGTHSLGTYFLVSVIVELLLTLITGPFTAAVSVVLYVDLLLRKRDPQLPALLA